MDQAPTPEQESIVNQFYSITGTENVPRETVVRLLSSNNWNLELAIIAYYQLNPESQRGFVANYTERLEMSNNGNGSNSIGNNDSRAGPSMVSRFMNLFTDSISSRVSRESSLLPGAFPTNADNSMGSPSKLHNWVNKSFFYIVLTVQFIVILPLILLWKLAVFLLGVTTERLIPILNKVLGLRLSTTNTYYAKKDLSNPVKRSRRFIYEFDEAINNKPLVDSPVSIDLSLGIKASDSSLMEINRPNFLECSYTNALYLVKKECKWLLLYLQSDEHEDKNAFIHQVLLHDHFLRFLKTNDILLWGANVKESEGYQVANVFNVSGFPFLGLITLVSEEGSSLPQVSLVAKIQGVSNNLTKSDGSINTAKIIQKFHKVFERLNPSVVALRADVQLRESARDLRSQQDLLYQRSLELDRRREEQRVLELQRQQEEEQRAREQENMRLQKVYYLRSRALEFKRRESQVDINDKKQISRVAIRFANGQRVQHVFHKTFTIEDIYLYVDFLLHEIDPEVELGSDDVSPAYVHEYDFKLISVMPRAELDLGNGQQLIGENNLVYPSGNLIVEQDE